MTLRQCLLLVQPESSVMSGTFVNEAPEPDLQILRRLTVRWSVWGSPWLHTSKRSMGVLYGDTGVKVFLFQLKLFVLTLVC